MPNLEELFSARKYIQILFWQVHTKEYVGFLFTAYHTCMCVCECVESGKTHLRCLHSVTLRRKELGRNTQGGRGKVYVVSAYITEAHLSDIGSECLI